MKVLFSYKKRADIDKNRIIIPKIIVDNYGRDFILEVRDDGTIRLVPESIAETIKQKEGE